MNFLAHMHLSCTEHGLLCGNFLGDFIRNKDLHLLTPEIRKGVELHRRIDSFTDTHPAVKRCTKILHPTQGKYAPVIVDVYFDYVLYKNWGIYSDVPFEEFEIEVYSTLMEHVDDFPERLKKMTHDMVSGHFLRSYTSLEGLDYTFSRMKKRFKFQSNIDKAVEDLKINYMMIEIYFNEFFPDMIKVVKEYCPC
jgi:acyl carrier protein phosphodiesterase